MAGIFLLLPRSKYSEFEKRELAEFPEFSMEKLKGAEFTSEVSEWFSDTEPYRDEFMTLSMSIRNALLSPFMDASEAVTFQAPAKGKKGNENAKIVSAGVMVVGKSPHVRALNAFGADPESGQKFADAVSQYAEELPDVQVYVMAIPMSSEFYTPKRAQNKTKPQLPVIKYVYSQLRHGAKGVDVYSAMAAHTNEDIYLRTDHHWAPLGVYYADKEFAKAAGVPFEPIEKYDRKVLKGFVGLMYGTSKNIAVKRSPEDFVWYKPKGATYATTYTNYKLNKKYRVESESEPEEGNYFYDYPDGHSGAYSMYLGSDKRLTHIHTGMKNGRRLAIVKDSYGNPVPSFLFHSFEDIHVIDFRYFPHNIKRYLKENGVTDLVFVLNVFNVATESTSIKIKRFLTQKDNSFAEKDEK